MPHYEIEFRNANNLASHKVGSYNHFHWLSQFGNLRLSPPPSSNGGLNPNRSFGFFFVPSRPSAVFANCRQRGRAAPLCGLSAKAWVGGRKATFGVLLSCWCSPAPQILTRTGNFLYNSELFRIRARGGRTGRACTRLDAHITSRKKHRAQQLFLDRS